MKIIVVIIIAFLPVFLYAQGITTGSMAGRVTNEKNEALIGAVIAAQHTPSGSKYITASQKDGSFNLPGVKIGGPYTIVISYIGYELDTIKNAQVNLGEELYVQVILNPATKSLIGVVVSGKKVPYLHQAKTVREH